MSNRRKKRKKKYTKEELEIFKIIAEIIKIIIDALVKLFK